MRHSYESHHEELNPVCKNLLSIFYYDTARFGCSSWLGARVIIIFFIHLARWRSHLVLPSGSPSISRWYAALLRCQHKALSCWYQIHRNLYVRCAEMVLNNDLLLNSVKPDVIAVDTLAQRRLAAKDFKINVVASALHLVDKIKSLGVYTDSYLSMYAEDNAVCRSCSYQIRAFRQIRPHFPAHLAMTVSCCILGSRLNYCNSMLTKKLAEIRGSPEQSRSDYS